MIVGLLFIATIWCLRGFLSYKQVVHTVYNSCNMGTSSIQRPSISSPKVAILDRFHFILASLFATWMVLLITYK